MVSSVDLSACNVGRCCCTLFAIKKLISSPAQSTNENTPSWTLVSRQCLLVKVLSLEMHSRWRPGRQGVESQVWALLNAMSIHSQLPSKLQGCLVREFKVAKTAELSLSRKHHVFVNHCQVSGFGLENWYLLSISVRLSWSKKIKASQASTLAHVSLWTLETVVVCSLTESETSSLQLYTAAAWALYPTLCFSSGPHLFQQDGFPASVDTISRQIPMIPCAFYSALCTTLWNRNLAAPALQQLVALGKDHWQRRACQRCPQNGRHST